jgi:molecular chaperone DnaJ
VVIEEEEHDELTRDGADLFYTAFVNITQAALGGPIEVPTLEGKVKIKIDPGTQPGKLLRLRGKGLPDINGYGKGDLIVSINVWIPKKVTKEEKKTLEKLSESPNFEPAPDNSEKSFFHKMRSFFE